MAKTNTASKNPPVKPRKKRAKKPVEKIRFQSNTNTHPREMEASLSEFFWNAYPEQYI